MWRSQVVALFVAAVAMASPTPLGADLLLSMVGGPLAGIVGAPPDGRPASEGTEPPEGDVEVPDLEGLTVEEAEEELEDVGLILISDGTDGTIVSQQPDAGSEVPPGSSVTVVLSDADPTPSGSGAGATLSATPTATATATAEPSPTLSETAAPTAPPETPGPTAIPPPPQPHIDAVELARATAQQCFEGELAYRPPNPMRVNEAKTVAVRAVSAKSTVDPADELPGTGDPVRRHPAICERMRAFLDGEGFTIRRIGEETGSRKVTDSLAVEWVWAVTPVQSGDRVLELQLFAEMEDGDDPVLIRTFRESIAVEVNRGYTISNWLKTWGPLTGLSVPVIVGAIVWFGRWWKSRKVIDIRDDLKPPKHAAIKNPARRRLRR